MSKGKKTIILIAAMGSNRAIGLNGRMPWHLPGELQHFKESTMGKAMVMGRKTWQAIGRPLPGRQNIVVSRNREFSAEGCDVVSSLDAAIDKARGKEVMIIGGGELYRQSMPIADQMILTLVDHAPEADTWFPDWDPRAWRVLGSREVTADPNNPHSYRVQVLTRM